MITLRPAAERGRTQIGWLDSRHTFSFGGYQDPAHMGFRSLRVINDDRVEPGMGFGEHGHRDMEIISYVLEGAMEHRDSLGTGSVIKPGDVQIMSAGTGIRHSEFNPSEEERVHFLQIWILPERAGLPPRYDQRHFTPEQRRGRLATLAARAPQDGAVVLHQDATLYAALLGSDEEVTHDVPAGRYGWVHVARGIASLNGQRLGEGDGAAITGPESLTIRGVGDSEVLVFDLE